MPTQAPLSDAELLAVVRSLRLHEKAALCSGQDAWHTQAIPRKGIPALRMADGPHGMRVVPPGQKKALPATCFPPAVALACSWSPALAARVAGAVAAEARHYGVGLVLGPGANIKRHPLCGRNFEYYSEDPLLCGEMAAASIAGLQGAGVGASLKHYAVNNQEKLRMSINAAVDDRALFDIYLKAFAIAVKKAQPDTVMASYNRVNGVYATENKRLLYDILRLRFGFSGTVVSDWGAVCNRPAGVAAGMDLEMPAAGGVNDRAVMRAVESGFLTEDALDAACLNILRLVFRRACTHRGVAPFPALAARGASALHHKAARGQPAHRPGTSAAPPPGAPCDWDAHHRLACDALCQSAVLLKNDGMLPLQGRARVAVIGEMAEKPRYQGGGSSHITPRRLTSFLSAMKAAGQPFVYAAGYRGAGAAAALTQAAVAAARRCEVTVLFLGLPDLYETEGVDRPHLRLPQSQLRLLAAVAAAAEKLCVVLCCGGPVETPWLEKANALLCLHVGGQAQGEAAVRLLYGRQNPSGKLAESWPHRLQDTPAFHHYPMGPHEVTYNESIYVGYRYYQTAQKPVAFPFGFGLSYTTYQYTGLTVSPQTLRPGDTLRAALRVKNTGPAFGEEVAQLYLARGPSATYQPAKELAAFARIPLAPGEEKEIVLSIPYEALAFYDTRSGADVVEAGAYELLAGPNSRETPLAAAFRVQGVTLEKDEAGLAAYGRVEDNRFPHEGFAAVYTGRLLGNAPIKKGRYTATTPLAEMRGSLWGRALLCLTMAVSRRVIRFSADKAANRLAATEMARDLPFKNLALHTSGLLSLRAAERLLALCNGRQRPPRAAAPRRPQAAGKEPSCAPKPTR